jgi:hypothetical protein
LTSKAKDADVEKLDHPITLKVRNNLFVALNANKKV